MECILLCKIQRFSLSFFRPGTGNMTTKTINHISDGKRREVTRWAKSTIFIDTIPLVSVYTQLGQTIRVFFAMENNCVLFIFTKGLLFLTPLGPIGKAVQSFVTEKQDSPSRYDPSLLNLRQNQDSQPFPPL